MMEWLSSKVAVAVAVLVITGSVLGYYAYQRSASYESEVAEAARTMARYVETFGSLMGEVRATVTLGEGGSLELPASISGKTLRVNLTRSSVVVSCGEYTVSEPHSATSIHLWQPGNGAYNATSIAALDAEHRWTGYVEAPRLFALQREEVEVSGETRLLTFCTVRDS